MTESVRLCQILLVLRVFEVFRCWFCEILKKDFGVLCGLEVVLGGF